MRLAEYSDDELLEELKRRGIKIEPDSHLKRTLVMAQGNAEDNLNRCKAQFKGDNLDELYGSETKRQIIEGYSGEYNKCRTPKIKIGGVVFDLK